LASLSEQEIQKRIQLGLVTPSIANPSGGSGTSSAMVMQESTTATDNDDDDDDVELEDWQDIPDNDKITPDDNDDVTYGDSSSRNGSTTGDLYIVDTQRRSSIDLEHMSINLHDTSIVMNAQPPHNGTTTGAEGTTSNTTRGVSLYDNNPHKRLRYRQSSIASISEEEPMVRSNSHNNIISSADGGGGGDRTISTPLDDEEIATVDGSCNDDDDDMDSMEIRNN
jgi:hypothetical protein